MTTETLPSQDRIAGLILAGGRGARMGGRDKALIPYDGEPLIAHISRQLASMVSRFYIARQADQADLCDFAEVIIDGEIDQGPLAGVLAGFRAAERFDFLLTVPVDTPLLPADLLARLGRVRAPHSVARADGREHPTFALYDLSQLEHAFADYAAGGRSLRGWLRTSGYGCADFPSKAIQNWNQSLKFS